MFDVAVFGSLFLTLFVIMDPPGITPIFLALTAGRPAKVQKRMAFQAVCVAFGVIAVFGVLGHQILDYLHVRFEAPGAAAGCAHLFSFPFRPAERLPTAVAAQRL